MTLDRRIDVDQLLREVNLPDVVGRFVDLKPNGDEHAGCCPFHDDTNPSFTLVPARGERPAFYHCFGCGANGNAIDFIMEHQGVTFKEACRRLGANDLRVGARPAPIPVPAAVEAWTPVLPVPAEAPPLNTDRIFNPKRGTSVFLRPQRQDAYKDQAGRLLGYVLRCPLPDGRKWTPTVTWCTGPEGQAARWCLKGFPKPRPLLGLPELATRSTSKVLVVSGERCQAEAAEVLSGFVVVTWPGGDQAWRHADWEPLFRRDVLLWPDADPSGARAIAGEVDDQGEYRPGLAAYLASMGAAVRVLDVAGQPEGWDVADALSEGWTAEQIRAWALPRIRPWGVLQGGTAEAPTAGGEASNREEDPSILQTERRPRASRAQAAAAVLEGAAGAVPTPSLYAPPAPTQAPVLATITPTGVGQKPQVRRARKDVAADGNTARVLAETEPHVIQWQRLGLNCNDRGMPFVNLDNVVRVLETDPRFRHESGAPRFWYDTFHARLFTDWMAPRREIGDADINALAVTLQRDLGLVKFSPELVYQGVLLVGSRSPRSEPHDWLDSLKWDGETRLETFLCDAFGAEDNEYVRAASKNFLLAMVARIFKPGCKVDSMVVLEGVQGVGKSSALAALGGPWYAEAHESVTSKDFFQVLHGKLLIEIGELDAFSRAEATRVKQVITCTTDRYRPPYGRAAQDFPRQCVFVGTTNEAEYLRDATGGRRFWPIRCTKIDVPAVLQARHQLFAEAVQRVRAGELWWLMPATAALEEQESRRQADAWEGVVSDYLHGRTHAALLDIARDALDIKTERVGRIEQLRIASILRHQGWEPRVVRHNMRTAREWVPPGTPKAPRSTKHAGIDD